MHAATADAVIDAINEYVEAKLDSIAPKASTTEVGQSVAQLDRAHERLRHVLMTGIA